ncbi:SDR family oxidoreductase [Trinickia terrae]|uniref:SDR family oxidoreductase n=1 Tax=Trinickia terrae TaxID=2571161 RepID=UPI00197F0FA6|nr:SDR family NAD(P)-dependent oxidoreductase [Trinickia terrae]
MTEALTNRPVAVVAGAGPGNGQALAKRFAEAGYAVALLARDRTSVTALAGAIPNARGYACDLGDAVQVAAVLASIRSELGEVDALLYNAGSGVFADVETITPEQFEASWRVNAFGALLCAKQVIPALAEGSPCRAGRRRRHRRHSWRAQTYARQAG